MQGSAAASTEAQETLWLELVEESTGFCLNGLVPGEAVVIGEVCLNESSEFAIDSFEGGAASLSCCCC